MTRGALVTIVISSGGTCRYGADGKRFDDALSREISHRNATRTIRGGDFSTPLRFGRNDGDGGSVFCHLPPSEMTRGALVTIVISSGGTCRYGADGKRFDDALSREISHRNATRTIRGGDFSTPLRFGRNDGGRGPAFL